VTDPKRDTILLNIPCLRLHNQQIAGTGCDSPGGLVKHLVAMQAQDHAGAKWSIGLRLPDATDSDVEKAIADRAIVRTWLMRGTLHFVAAEDVHWILGLVAPRIISGSATRHQQLDLDNGTFAHCKEIFLNALQGGRHLTRDEMYALLEKAHISTTGQRGYHILWWAALEGLICFGPQDGKQQTFVLLDEWVPKKKILGRNQALAELARRYFASRGPATLQDFVWWSGLKITDARAGLIAAASELGQFTVDGQTYWMSSDTANVFEKMQRIYLLPGFDEYMLGYKDRTAILDPHDAHQIVPWKNGMFSSTIVMDGRITGTWRRTFKRGSVIIKPQPFVAFTAKELEQFSAAADHYGRFLGMPVIISEISI
jgi:hypothetical protein